MTFAQGVQTRHTYITEVTYGLTPNTPQMTGLDVLTSSINFTKQTHTDESITGNRQIKNTGHGNTLVSGDIATNFKYSEYDPFLEALLSGAFSTDVLVPGSTRKSFTIEEGSLDIGQYRKFSGAMVNSLSLTIPLQGFTQATWNIMAQGHAISNTSLDNSITAATEGVPYFHGVALINEGGSSSGIVSDITLKIDNGLAAMYALGNTAPVDFSQSWISVTGQLTAYWADAVMYNKFVNADDSSLDVILQDAAGNSLEINLPNIQYSGATKSISGQGPQSLVMPFTARYDSGTGAHIQITRVAA